MQADSSKEQKAEFAIEFRNVSFSFNGQPAVQELTFQLRRSEMIFITGASGSGKSVLLHLAMGLLRPDEGQIFIEGREIESLKETELLAIRGGLMGMVFQEDSLFTGMTVYDNAAYRLAEHGWAESDIDEAVNEVLKYVGLDGEEEKYPEELSGGMKRRLEIARALIGWPSIMLFDEPTMSLDPIMAVQVLDLILRARDINKISSLYVTKKPAELPYLATYRAVETGPEEITVIEAPRDQLPDTRVMVLESGRIVFCGSWSEFQQSKLPVIEELSGLDPHDHTQEPHFQNPWDKARKPKTGIL
jgi:phospholipid/cholesterol/gamma-HCH transport system ATP-binding protein